MTYYREILALPLQPGGFLAFLEPQLHIFCFWHLPAPDLFFSLREREIFLLSLNLRLHVHSYFRRSPTFCLTLAETAAAGASASLGGGFYQVCPLPGPRAHPD